MCQEGPSPPITTPSTCLCGVFPGPALWPCPATTCHHTALDRTSPPPHGQLAGLVAVPMPRSPPHACPGQRGSPGCTRDSWVLSPALPLARCVVRAVWPGPDPPPGPRDPSIQQGTGPQRWRAGPGPEALTPGSMGTSFLHQPCPMRDLRVRETTIHKHFHEHNQEVAFCFQ